MGVCMFVCVFQLAPDDAWRCPHCKQLQQGRIKLSLWTLPDVLILHLKRFRQVLQLDTFHTEHRHLNPDILSENQEWNHSCLYFKSSCLFSQFVFEFRARYQISILFSSSDC